MPRVGAKIRVTVIHPDGETVEASGPLIDIRRYSDDGVTWLRLPGGLLFAVEDGDSAVNRGGARAAETRTAASAAVERRHEYRIVDPPLTQETR